MRLLKGLYVCHPQLIRINYIFHSTAEVRELYFVFRHSKIEYFSLVMAIFFNDCVSLLSFFLFLFFFSFFFYSLTFHYKLHTPLHLIQFKVVTIGLFQIKINYFSFMFK